MIGQVRQHYIVLKNERFFKIIGITCLIVLYGALAIFFADRYYHARGAGGTFDAIYWAVVTITTVGYGDIVPSSTVGKVFALMIVLSGPALLSLITASIASIFIERKIKEGKGLESIKDKDHIIICGWNENGEKVIDGILSQSKGSQVKVVLVEVVNITREKRFREGDVIMKEGEKGNTMYMVVEGEVEVSKGLTMKFGDDDFRKTDKVLTRFRSQDHVIFGEMALIGQDSRSASIVAKADCILLEIKRDDFLRLIESRPQLGVKVLLKLSELLVSRLRRSGQDIVRLTTALSIALSK